MARVLRERHGRTTGVSFDIDGTAAFGRDMELLGNRIPWFQERAIQTLARRLSVEARRDIQAEYNITATRVRNHMRATVVRGEGSARLTGVRLTGQWKRGIGLLNFSGRQTRKGVTYSVYRGRRQLEAHAFIARMKSGNLHAVQRIPGAKTWKRTYTDRKGKQRERMDQPLDVLYRSTVAQMLAKGRRPERLLDYSRNLLRADVERQIGSYLRNHR
ncbi:hypothetical protein [Marilutibacter alkalisoli]|uniref:Uncharacterized protein n=1 Tax=Marilutibacter alkalisoli TaxID=2591633 RepID=A0A514BU00_9GAMM|nr:hypothetical protein [Lysobacter alkalisoli]QDH70846.1 hypothetical protein FKV23_12705 [Lysobacter alkalisoli]